MKTQIEITELPYLTRRHCLEIADNGDDWNYNRQLDPLAIRTLPSDKNCVYPVVCAFIHQHRHGVPCEDHMRLMFEAPGSPAICDVPMAYAATLPTSIRVHVNGRLVAALLLDEKGKPLSLRHGRLNKSVRKGIQHLVRHCKNRRIGAFIQSRLRRAAA